MNAPDLVALLGSRVHIDVTIPRTAIRGRMRLCSRSERSAIHAETRLHFSSMGTPVTGATLAEPDVMSEHLAERAVRHLAIAVRDPKDEAKPLLELGSWRDLDDDQIGALWVTYNDHATKIDPIGQSTELTVEEVGQLRAAAGKGDVDSLMSFGSRKLAIFATTSVEPPAT